MPVFVACPTCGHKKNAPASFAGRRIKCPKCATTFAVPYPYGEPANSVSALSSPTAPLVDRHDSKTPGPSVGHASAEGEPIRALGKLPMRASVAIRNDGASPTPAVSNLVEGLAVSVTELRKTKRIVRAYRWQRRLNRARIRVLRMHTTFLESFRLYDQGWLAPSLVLGLPAFVVGVLISLSFHFSPGLTLVTATAFFAFATAWAGFFYHAMPHKRIQQELKRLQGQDSADQDRMHTYDQRHNELTVIVEKMKRAEAERAHHQQQIEYRKET